MTIDEKVTLSEEKETLLITVYGKAEESRLPDSLLRDRFAADAIRRVDYDFSKLKVRRDDMISLAIRAHLLDGWTRDFLARHPDATVLHLGCGLDSRVFRVDPPASVRWFDVDYPEVIALRRRLYPERAGYTLLGSSLTAPQWLDEVPADRPAMIVAEGVLPYLREDEVPRLFGRLTAHFPAGECAFDCYSRLGVRLLRRHHSIKATGASVHWGLDDPHELEVQVPKLVFLTEMSSHDPAQLARMSRVARLSYRVFMAIPALKKAGRMVRYGFE
ncbi:class I SAM-dependent methyltransferase [Polyangium mundeleinium]|uniref:Class I SAM-dependent methyltransferase n=1 Tax=Polyangium mundeleinium TaxID=2995306 RepID=A0ABT5ENS8_9BACT|nr:class I SAM-dependent methyltransferase [Polyangium mundeleinium]MDC0743017.1 class I SAM-dependent methyltransferase [Polyangium mundeleinium]